MKSFGGIVPILAAVLLIILLIGPLLIPLSPLKNTVPPERLADPDSQFIDVNDVHVHYKIAGEGEPTLVLLHGFGASVFSWREVMAPLAEVGTVIAFDRPAFGLTSRPLPGEWGDQNPYGAEVQADLTVALLDKLGLEGAVLVGHSAGGTAWRSTASQRLTASLFGDCRSKEFSACSDNKWENGIDYGADNSPHDRRS